MIHPYIPMACAPPSTVHNQLVKQSLKVNAAHFHRKGSWQISPVCCCFCSITLSLLCLKNKKWKNLFLCEYIDQNNEFYISVSATVLQFNFLLNIKLITSLHFSVVSLFSILIDFICVIPDSVLLLVLLFFLITICEWEDMVIYVWMHRSTFMTRCG